MHTCPTLESTIRITLTRVADTTTVRIRYCNAIVGVLRPPTHAWRPHVATIHFCHPRTLPRGTVHLARKHEITELLLDFMHTCGCIHRGGCGHRRGGSHCRGGACGLCGCVKGAAAL